MVFVVMGLRAIGWSLNSYQMGSHSTKTIDPRLSL